MSAIQSNVGLITGIPIQQTVDQLISLSARPRNLLQSRTDELRGEQGAVDRLASLVLSLQFSANKFKSDSTFGGRAITASSESISAQAASGSTPTPGSYQFTPLQTASAHQLVSGSFSDIQDAVGDGTLRFGFGGHVDKGARLADLNNGAGVAAGSIKITDKSGDTAVIDLRAASSVDDVVRAINESNDVNVTASTDGDAFTLTDNTGGAGTLSVAEVGLGTTAAGLGLAGLSTVGVSLIGSDVYGLHNGTKLAAVNDGNGVRTVAGIDDLVITLRDGATEIGVDLSDAKTLGEVVDAINNDEDNAGDLTAAISADGRRLELTDNTGATAANLIVANGAVGSAADDLGIAADVASASVTGERIIAGLKDTLVSSLNGGAGISLGQIDVTDRDGTSDTIDLSSAETLGDVVDLINASSADVTAAINSSRNGIAIVDNTGGSGNLTIAEVGVGTTAADLGIAIDSAADSVNGSSLNRQTVSEATRLADFQGGKGVSVGDIKITDSTGATHAVDLNPSSGEAETIGDVIDAINAASGGAVVASINEAGDGVLLTDTTTGEGALTVVEVGNGTTAADLNLLGASTTTNGSGQQTIDGSTSYAIDLTDLQQSATDISLANLNGGDGIDLGVFNVVASNGENFAVDLGLAGNEAFTVGDVIDKINTAAAAANSGAGIAVSAALNEAGTGIVIADATTPVDGGELTIEDLGSGSAAADLNLIRTTADGEDDTIDGGGLFSATDAEQGALETLVDRINDLDAGVTASLFTDLNGSRLAITADTPGAANELLIDGSTTDFAFQETSRPADAVALFGGGSGFAVRSATNTFEGVAGGLDVTINEADGQSVQIDVGEDAQPLVKAVEDFVEAYNSIRSNLDAVTDFDEETLSTGILFGRNEALRVDADLSRILSSRVLSNTEYGSLESIGVSLDDDGKLSLDKSKLEDAFADDRAAVDRLFNDEDSGLVTRLTTTIDQLAGDDNSLLSSRSDALERTIDSNTNRIETLGESLERERERLLLEFFRLEETISLLQSNSDAIGNIQPITFASARSNSN